MSYRSVLCACLMALALPAGAQIAPLADRTGGVKFYYVPAPGVPAIETRHVAALMRHIAVDFGDTPVTDALETIARVAGLHITYQTRDDHTGPLQGHVTLRAENITVEAALTDVLADAGVDVQLSATGVLAIVPRNASGGLPRQPASGRVVGRVTEALTARPVDQVAVRIDELNIGAMTGADGRYVITPVPSGSYHVTTRRVGFVSVTRIVTVANDSTATADFTLTVTPTKLDEVVTTAVGDQRRYQIGNDIGSIKVDSLAPTTPVTSLTDVISARVPGVEVMESNGEVGNGPALRIRGNGSLVLQGDPIIIVDGVRQDNTPGGATSLLFGSSTSGGSVPAPSRLNDIDFNDVESIDILKGPSASTEYGTDAANGVIVIKTKHSQAGAPRWTLSAEQGLSEVGTPFPDTYWSYGHTPGANPKPTQCAIVPSILISTPGWTAGTCVRDRVVQFTALNNPRTSMFGDGNRQKVDLSVGGGSDAVRYYVAAGLTNEVGTLQMPSVFMPMADSIGLPKGQWRPNTDEQRSARGNTVVKLNPTADLQLNAAYMTTNQSAPSTPSLYEAPYLRPPIDDAAHHWGYGTPSDNYLWPAIAYGAFAGQSTERLTGNLAANWTPFPWLSAHATVGVDHASQRATDEVLPQVAFADEYQPYPQLGITNGTNDIYSFDGRATATTRLTPILRAITSAGLQLVDTRTQATNAQSNSISVSNPTLNGATTSLISQVGIRYATLGGYFEEQLGLWDRLFLTGAVRVDAGSNFGSGYTAIAYPKASVSWLALSGATSLRLRGAFGESGIQPPNGAALELFGAQAAFANGAPVGTAGIVNVANSNLQPERSTEFEGGVDVGLLHDRIDVSLTGYAKTTNNALVETGTGWEAGNYNSFENVGEVTNNGFEANVSAILVRSRALTWDMAFNVSTNHNNLVKLAPGLTTQPLYGDHAEFRFAPGTPLYGYAAEKEHFTDLNHDGIVEANEASVEDSLSYAGPSQPTIMSSFSTHVGVLHGLLSFGALLDYRGGFRLLNTTELHSAEAQTDVASNNPHAPLWEQIRDVAYDYAYARGLDNNAPSIGFYEDASYVRFRELSVTLALPDRFAHAAHFHSLSLTGAIRNLALWTPYTGGDPEVTSSEGGGTSFQPTTNSVTVNHDIRENAQAVPLSRYFILRLNAGF